MHSYIQILTFIFSFFYGIFFYLLTRFNNYILNGKKSIVKMLITLVFIIDIVILYIYLMFRINHGYFHIYFLVTLCLGFIIMLILYPIIISKCKINVKKLKRSKIKR